MSLNVMKVEMKVLVEDATLRRGFIAEHGLSVFLEAEHEDGSKVTLLLDAGATGDVLLHNAEKLSVPLGNIDAVVLSHGHYDHTGGLLKLLEKINGSNLPIVVHPDAFKQKYCVEEGIEYVGIPFNISELRERGAIVSQCVNSFKLSEAIFTTGEVERITDFEETPKSFYYVKENRFERDFMLDDQALIIKHTEGLIIVTGCSHSGIVNILMHAQKITGEKRIYAIIGGLHLIDANEEKIEKTVDFIYKNQPQIVAACHCTGFKAQKHLSDKLRDSFKEIHCGDTLII
ncbi:MAG: MBL fold metallo-hydrolase [Candidatus Baldrarchaeia archaeon]|nr:MBL fold metallo-hydrolase [Candidatus Baldrarchaeota archaeon]